MKLINILNSIILESEPQGRNINDSFWRWFGNSKAVKNGNPAIFYHGTSAIFDEFQKSSRGAFGLGYYFTTDEKEAKGYGKTMMKVFLKLEKPATPKEVQEIMLSIEDRRDLDDKELAQKTTEKLKSAGFDGILFNYPNGDLLAMVINANQIKSVKNKGTWSSSNNINEKT